MKFAGRFRESGIEINDHRSEEIWRTEFGLPPSNMRGAFGNEGALRFFASNRAQRFHDYSLQPMATELPPEEDRPGVPIAPPLLFVIPILLSLAIEWLRPTSLLSGAMRWMLGLLIFSLGTVLNIGGFITQKRAGTDPIPFNPSTRIVTHGLYRFTRNPMYIGFALWTLGIAILIDSAWTLLAAPIGLVLIDRLVITREERYLERKFGEEYFKYKRRVRRWI
jgi:protein-S-isoprenylcysteine O-methyltransferase Ste14